MDIQHFYLQRNVDVNGKSGIGVVARGVVLPSGHCIMEWLTFTSSIGYYKNLTDLIEIHSHQGRTEIIMGDPPKKRGRKKNA